MSQPGRHHLSSSRVRLQGPAVSHHTATSNQGFFLWPLSQPPVAPILRPPSPISGLGGTGGGLHRLYTSVPLSPEWGSSPLKLMDLGSSVWPSLYLLPLKRWCPLSRQPGRFLPGPGGVWPAPHIPQLAAPTQTVLGHSCVCSPRPRAPAVPSSDKACSLGAFSFQPVHSL